MHSESCNSKDEERGVLQNGDFASGFRYWGPVGNVITSPNAAGTQKGGAVFNANETACNGILYQNIRVQEGATYELKYEIGSFGKKGSIMYMSACLYSDYIIVDPFNPYPENEFYTVDYIFEWKSQDLWLRMSDSTSDLNAKGCQLIVKDIVLQKVISPGHYGPNLLPSPNFGNPSDWGGEGAVEFSASEAIFHPGGSLPYGTIEQIVKDIEPGKYSISYKIRAEGVRGKQQSLFVTMNNTFRVNQPGFDAQKFIQLEQNVDGSPYFGSYSYVFKAKKSEYTVEFRDYSSNNSSDNGGESADIVVRDVSCIRVG